MVFASFDKATTHPSLLERTTMGLFFRSGLKILSQDALKPYAGKEVGPGSDKISNEDLNEYIRSNAETAYHPSCTLKMGIDKMAVVGENLKIHGLQNIRVIDSSVMPEITSGNLNAPTLMIAEKGSDIINSSN